EFRRVLFRSVSGTTGSVGVGGNSGSDSTSSVDSIGSLLISELDSSSLSLSSELDSLSSALDTCDNSEFLEKLICSALRFGISSLSNCALTKINNKKGAITVITIIANNTLDSVVASFTGWLRAVLEYC